MCVCVCVCVCADVQGGGDSQAATLDSLSKKLSDDLRQHIKSLGSYSLLSKEWLATVRPRPVELPHLLCTRKRLPEPLRTLLAARACPNITYTTDHTCISAG